MTAKKIAAKAGTSEDSPSAEVEFDFGDNLAEAVELFGDDVVFNRFVAATTVDIQALMRRMLTEKTAEDGKVVKAVSTADEIQKAVTEYKPGVSQRKRLSGKEKAVRALEALSDEDRNALLDSLMASVT